jgi:hypothetical protein
MPVQNASKALGVDEKIKKIKIDTPSKARHDGARFLRA